MANWGNSLPSPKIPNFALPVKTSFLPSTLQDLLRNAIL